jgi:hypothetical protein
VYSACPANWNPESPRSKQPSIVLCMHVNFASLYYMQRTPARGGAPPQRTKRHRIKGLVVNQKLAGLFGFRVLHMVL